MREICQRSIGSECEPLTPVLGIDIAHTVTRKLQPILKRRSDGLTFSIDSGKKITVIVPCLSQIMVFKKCALRAFENEYNWRERKQQLFAPIATNRDNQQTL